MCIRDRLRDSPSHRLKGLACLQPHGSWGGDGDRLHLLASEDGAQPAASQRVILLQDDGGQNRETLSGWAYDHGRGAFREGSPQRVFGLEHILTPESGGRG